MNIRVYPAQLSGTFSPPSSKSASHRAVIAAALARGESQIEALADNNDITATANAMCALGAQIARQGRTAMISGITRACTQAQLRCGESGSTLRFLLPVAAALGVTATFHGEGRLPGRPIDMLLKELRKNGVSDDYEGSMPFTVRGRLRGGRYEIDGSVSSQFVTGLLFALPLCEDDSQIVLRGRLESRPYVDMTVSVLSRFGV
ncbi:MAG: 3-phosphoshikimate 1-carboxyvinyltransferase, partial [Acetanaerobacterium sp.]